MIDWVETCVLEHPVDYQFIPDITPFRADLDINIGLEFELRSGSLTLYQID
jgi:hypothetical protein